MLQGLRVERLTTCAVVRPLAPVTAAVVVVLLVRDQQQTALLPVTRALRGQTEATVLPVLAPAPVHGADMVRIHGLTRGSATGVMSGVSDFTSRMSRMGSCPKSLYHRSGFQHPRFFSGHSRAFSFLEAMGRRPPRENRRRRSPIDAGGYRLLPNQRPTPPTIDRTRRRPTTFVLPHLFCPASVGAPSQ